MPHTTVYRHLLKLARSYVCITYSPGAKRMSRHSRHDSAAYRSSCFSGFKSRVGHREGSKNFDEACEILVTAIKPLISRRTVERWVALFKFVLAVMLTVHIMYFLANIYRKLPVFQR